MTWKKAPGGEPSAKRDLARCSTKAVWTSGGRCTFSASIAWAAIAMLAAGAPGIFSARKDSAKTTRWR